jgi:hypothetical protein
MDVRSALYQRITDLLMGHTESHTQSHDVPELGWLRNIPEAKSGWYAKKIAIEGK